MKPWPRDAIMITAARAGEEKQEQMESPFPAYCRDCNASLMACSRTYETAKQISKRCDNRPIMFFCIDCHNKYDIEQCNLLVDQRERKDQWTFR